MLSYQSRLMWLAICLLLASRFAVPLEAAESPRPNIIFILVDDQGYYDLGCYGATEVKTPRIDAMAKEGIRFTDYYAAAPICSPSRAGLLTGCYPRRIGNHVWVHRADSKSGLHPDELTLAELLKTGGYVTACIGKWHLGFEEPFLPKSQGFDHYFGLLHNVDPVEVVYFKDKGGVPLMRNDRVVKRPANPAELTRLYTDEAIDFIKKNKAEPFFLYLPHTMLHNPLGVSEAFRERSNWGEYGDAIQELDHHVGRIFDTLKEDVRHRNTIVVYASDNGRGPGRTAKQQLRGRKLSTFEAGIRVPAIVWGPDLGVRAGQESSAVVRAMDWYPTLATFAGIEVPQSRVIDGRDISPLLKSKWASVDSVPAPGSQSSLNAYVPLRRRWDPPGEWKSLIKRNEYNDAFFYHGSQGALAAVRWKNWKLVLNPSPQLHDLEKDPGETRVVRNREITRRLRGMAILFQEEMRRDARPAGDEFLENELARRSAVHGQGPMKPYDESIDGVATKIHMVPIPGGNFRMGSTEDEPNRQKDEGPQHEVFISPFWMASTETTWDLYDAWVNDAEIRKRVKKAGSDAKSETRLSQPTAPYLPMDFGLGRVGRPAVNITNYAASEFCKWLSKKTGKDYRLPTEAEWEYACRAGSSTAFSWGDDEKEMDKYAWYYENSPDEYQKVGMLKPNVWGLYDMHGNVSEWVIDQYSADGYAVDLDSNKPRLNPLVRPTTEYPRVYRGGSYEDDAKDLRAAKRFKSGPELKQQDPQIPKGIWWNTDSYFIGFRIVRPFEDPSRKTENQPPAR